MEDFTAKFKSNKHFVLKKLECNDDTLIKEVEIHAIDPANTEAEEIPLYKVQVIHNEANVDIVVEILNPGLADQLGQVKHNCRVV